MQEVQTRIQFCKSHTTAMVKHRKSQNYFSVFYGGFFENCIITEVTYKILFLPLGPPPFHPCL